MSLILAVSTKISAQSFSYSYTDPCTGNIKSITVPTNGGVAVSYYGQVKSFTYNEFINGTFDNWANSTFAQFQATSPCAEVVGLGTAVNVTQGQTLSIIGILNSLTAVADMASSGASNIVGGTASSVSNSSSGTTDKKSNNTNPSTTTPGSTTPGTTAPGGGSTGSSTTTDNSTTNGNNNNGSGTGTGSSGSTSGSSNGSSGSTTSGNGTASGSTGEGSSGGTGSSTNSNSGSTETKTEGSTNITAGGTQTVKGGSSSGTVKAKSAGSKEGGKPSIVASGDFVGFNFKNSETSLGAKASGGYTSLRWDGARSHGVMADYTSALKGPNVTGFYAWIKPKSTSLISMTATIGFEGYGSQYVTVAVGQMRSFNKIKKFKIVYMATGSFGQVYKEKFIGTALIAGAMYDWKVSKKIDIKLMNLAIYAPYVSYYNDVVLKSPFVVLPSIGTNIGITKRFKFNINCGGAWALNNATLNYTVTMGTRLLL